MNEPLGFLLDTDPRTVRERRQARGNWNQIHPPTLLEKYHEPELALAAAIVQLAADDIRQDKAREDCFVFLRSDWFSLIARGLEFHPETLRALELT